jgi:hypothetical protein
MPRRFSIVFAALLLGAMALVATTAASAGSFQTDDTADAAADAPIVAASLVMGEVWEGDGIDVTVDTLFADESPEALATGASEVLLGVSLRNSGAVAIPFDAHALGRDRALRFTMIDSAGDRYPVDLLHPGANAATGADVAWIEVGLAARATVGFSVPTDRTDAMDVELSVNGTAVAVWDLTSPEAGVFWSAPSLATVHLDDTVTWGDGVSVVPLALGSLQCGDPSIEPVAQIVAVTFEVSNDTPDMVPWPATEGPVPAAVAQWADGGGAELSLETGYDDLWKRSEATVYLPPFSVTEQSLVFAAPRDGRLVDPDALPYGVWLGPPDASPVWLDLAAEQATVGVDPAFCDLGFQGAPVPYSYSPGPKYRIGGEGPFADTAAKDNTARALINSVLAGAGLLYDDYNETFAAATQSRLESRVPNVTVVNHTAGTSPSGTVGTVYWDDDSSDRDFFYVITRSASGTWLCAGATAGEVPVRAEGSTAKVAGEVCFPDAWS